ncbi:CKLF-like MARVEL transmembrane domain-containing protein 2B [Mus musculus]|uniref:CKLF-like MARVEL transmembrane domain-containing protein 2B n=1 Tax=Mus musculus TaxID=10090 RepID=CLF2B_MOUSE|nr:CKLF-like MARVEL transmembrane domain-containing protein 2B [Mus musculus]Q9DAC0.1 RecName: Full=CKLF-like MARVEL transmembrane domain-containing protein 2B; AltName: Full=Chemokine-like factor superfamily member 2B [Mus musculus]AAH60997.1 CKLF-like MARVEL transmembrane domain containing 2B [Mus musculus]AAO34103.1 chemokine-like factor superfamily 2b [Mus musculus]AAP33494.1 chemokine-like factor superfamily 2 isoform 2 [Mus musculus]EDL11210.1 CKLF-like MARVEL transmembrane domain contai|eukprot:NP_082800.1 CKLF-like MARVEL transmembrane domain-containing protein 2B [Mus musculus]
MAAPAPRARTGGKKKDERRGFKGYKWEFRDSNKDFWAQGHAECKSLIMILLIAAMVCFQRVATHPIVILLLTMELSICAFFFFLYSLAINRYIPFVFWPMMDLMNDLACSTFLIGGIFFALEARRELPVPYLTGMILMGVTAFISIIDLCLQRRQFKSRKLRKFILLTPDRKGKKQDPKLLLMLAAKEDEEERQRELAEKAKRESMDPGW